MNNQSFDNMSLRKLRKNNDGNVDMILTAIIAGVMFAIAIPIIYSVLGGINYTTVDAQLSGTPATNASNQVLSSLNTFFTIGPKLKCQGNQSLIV